MNSDLLREWLSLPSVAYVSECLQCCETAQMVEDLRSFVPREALRAATTKLSLEKRQQLKVWVVEQNLKKEVAA